MADDEITPLSSIVTEPVSEELGPCMLRLTERRRAFVIAMIERPTARASQWAKDAGYEGNTEALRRRGFLLRGDSAILDALREETEKRVKLGGTIGVMGLIRMAIDKKSKHQFKACLALADRGGFAPVFRQEVKVEHTDRSGAAMVDRIKQLALQLGMDPAKLLGDEAAPMKLIEGTVDNGSSDGNSDRKIA